MLCACSIVSRNPINGDTGKFERAVYFFLQLLYVFDRDTFCAHLKVHALMGVLQGTIELFSFGLESKTSKPNVNRVSEVLIGSTNSRRTRVPSD